MGYRSEWQLTIAASNDAALKTVLQWMLDYTNNSTNTVEQRDIMAEILKCAVTPISSHIVFADDCTKCYPPWDDVISAIHNHVDNDADLDFDYVRIGEELDDIETIYGKGYISTCINRTIEEPDVSSIPSSQQAIPSAITPRALPSGTKINVLPAKRQEEECSTCKRMKDIGIKCWCCGN